MARLAADLPRDLPAAVFVVHHFPAESESALPSIVARAGELPALHPDHGQQIDLGRIYVAPRGWTCSSRQSHPVNRKNFLNLDIGLPVEKLKGAIRSCLSQNEPYTELTVDAVNRRGKAVEVKVTCSQLPDPHGGDPRGVILLMEEANGST